MRTTTEGQWVEGEPILNRIIMVWTTENVLYGPVALADARLRSEYYKRLKGKPSHYLILPIAPRHNAEQTEQERN